MTAEMGKKLREFMLGNLKEEGQLTPVFREGGKCFVKFDHISIRNGDSGIEAACSYNGDVVVTMPLDDANGDIKIAGGREITLTGITCRVEMKLM